MSEESERGEFELGFVVRGERVESEEKPDGGFVEVPRDFEKCLKWVQSQMWKSNYRPLVKVVHVPEIHTWQH